MRKKTEKPPIICPSCTAAGYDACTHEPAPPAPLPAVSLPRTPDNMTSMQKAAEIAQMETGNAEIDDLLLAVIHKLTAPKEQRSLPALVPAPVPVPKIDGRSSEATRQKRRDAWVIRRKKLEEAKRAKEAS